MMAGRGATRDALIGAARTMQCGGVSCRPRVDAGVPFPAALRRPSAAPERRSSSRACRETALNYILRAVRAQRRTGYEAGVVRGEEHHAARDLFRLAETADRDQRQDALFQHIL